MVRPGRILAPTRSDPERPPGGPEPRRAAGEFIGPTPVADEVLHILGHFCHQSNRLRCIMVHSYFTLFECFV